MIKKTSDKKKTIKRSYLNEMGKDIELFPGVTEWFKRINDFGKEHGVIIEHYIISSGLKEIIENSAIGPYFKQIYASEFYYDENGDAVWPKLAVNYTNKTQFLIRIKKGVLDISDDYNLNKKMLENERRISTSNMIYIGDGITDVPCMKLTKDGGGVSIAVYNQKSIKTAKSLYDDNRINYFVPADYQKDSAIDTIVKKTIMSMALDTELKNISYEESTKEYF